MLYSGGGKLIPIIRSGPHVVEAAASSQLVFKDLPSVEVAEQFNSMLKIMLPDESSASDEHMRSEQFDALEARFAKVEEEYLDIRAERYALRKSASKTEDLGADCDGNRCKSEKKNEPISAGETDLFVHDDQDRGSVTVFCQSGEIEVIISTAVWSTFNEYDRKRLSAGQTWKRDIASQHSWFDQTNKVEVVGKVDAVYNLDFTSWDD